MVKNTPKILEDTKGRKVKSGRATGKKQVLQSVKLPTGKTSESANNSLGGK